MAIGQISAIMITTVLSRLLNWVRETGTDWRSGWDTPLARSDRCPPRLFGIGAGFRLEQNRRLILRDDEGSTAGFRDAGHLSRRFQGEEEALVQPGAGRLEVPLKGHQAPYTRMPSSPSVAKM